MNIWSNAIITKQGLTLEAKLTAGKALIITKAQSGAGTVNESELANQTTVTNPKQALTFRNIKYPAPGTATLPVYLLNDGLATGYTATQIGIYAQDPDAGEILYMIAQAASGKGTDVPSAEEMPGYTAEWAFSFTYGQASSVSATVDPANTVSVAEAQTMITESINAYEVTVNQALAGKANTQHTHGAADITSGILSVARGGTGNGSIDTAPTAGSTKMVTSGGIKTALDGKANTSHQHAATDITSGVLPVTRGGTGNSEVDTTPTASSTRMVTSGGIKTALDGKANTSHVHDAANITTGTLAVARGGTGNSSADTVPTAGSTRMVTSGGIKTALDGKANASHVHAATDITSGVLAVARGGTGNASVDTTPTSGSTKMVTSGGLYTALAGKQKNITYGTAVPSGGSDGDIYIQY